MHGHHEHWGHGCGGHWASPRFFGRGGYGGFGGGRFGRGHGGPFSRRGPRMFDAGALRLVVLGLVADEPRHGYDIIKALEARFHGAYSPSPGAIYPMLQMMEEADLVASQTSGNKRLYTITEAGRAYLKENKADLDRLNEQLDEVSGDMQGAALGEAVRELRRSLHQRLHGGELNSEQTEKLAEILRKARKEIDGL